MTAYVCTISNLSGNLSATVNPPLPATVSDADTFQMNTSLTNITWSCSPSPFSNGFTSGSVPAGPYNFEAANGSLSFDIVFSSSAGGVVDITGSASVSIDITVNNGTGDV